MSEGHRCIISVGESKNWSFTVLRKIFSPKRGEQTCEWKKLNNVELHNLYGNADIRRLKSRRLWWAGHVVRMGNKRRATQLLLGKPEGKRPCGGSKIRW